MIETVAGLTDLQIKLITAIGQIAIALALGSITAFIAWRQSQTAQRQAETAQKKLKADLFDKRLAALSEIEDPLIELLKGEVKHEYSIRISRGARRFKYLFNESATGVAEQISKTAIDLAITTQQIKDQPFDAQNRQMLLQHSLALSKGLHPLLMKLHDECSSEMTLAE